MALEELQREVGITFSCLFFILSNPPLPTPRCHDQGAGEKGHRQDCQGLCHHWFCCLSWHKVHLHWQGRGGVQDADAGRAGLPWDQAVEGD